MIGDPVVLDFKRCVAFTTAPENEGGFSNNPLDPGGATYKGITLATFRSFANDNSLGIPALKAMSDSQIEAIYGSRYWNALKGDSLPAGVNLLVFDFGVNAGVSRSAKMLQTRLPTGGGADGWIGPSTLKALAATPTASVVEWLVSDQEAHYRSLATFSTFGKGWLARLSRRAVLARAAVRA